METAKEKRFKVIDTLNRFSYMAKGKNMKKNSILFLTGYLAGSYFVLSRMQTQLREKNNDTKDIVTGIANRNCYEKNKHIWNRRHYISLVCIFVDVDGLHEYNNQNGHAAGDKMLRYIAQMLKKYLSNTNTFRMGGDEFLIIIPDCTYEEAHKRCEFVQKCIQTRGYHISYGISYRKGNYAIDEMMAESDRKMYQAKNNYYKTIGNRRMQRN